MVDFILLVEKLGFPIAIAILLYKMVNDNKNFMQKLVEATIKDNTEAITNLTSELKKSRDKNYI